jgi:hypothetical protein
MGWVRIILGNCLMALGEAILPPTDRHPACWPNSQIDDEMRMSSD